MTFPIMFSRTIVSHHVVMGLLGSLGERQECELCGSGNFILVMIKGNFFTFAFGGA